MSAGQDIAAAIVAANAAVPISTIPWTGDQNTQCGRWYAQILSYNDLIDGMKASIFSLVASTQSKINEISLTMSNISDVQDKIKKLTAPQGVLWQIQQSIDAAYDLFKDPSLTSAQIGQLRAGLKQMQSKLSEVQSDLRGYENDLKQYQNTLSTQKADLDADDIRLTSLTSQLVSMTKTINEVVTQYVSECGTRYPEGSQGPSGTTGSTGSTGGTSGSTGGATGTSGFSGISGRVGP